MPKAPKRLPRVVQPVYSLREGFRLPKDVPVETVAASIERLKRAHGGAITPAAVVAAAEPLESPLHACFTWDDTQAARLQREAEARRIITCYYVEFKPRDAPPTQVVGNISFRNNEGERSYVTSSRTLTEDEVRLQATAEIERMLSSVLKRYRHLVGVRSALLDAVERIIRADDAA